MKRLVIKKTSTILMILICQLIYSVVGFFIKRASGYSIFDMGIYLNWGVAILGLGVYAVIWQKLLRDISLSSLYATKGIAIIFTTLIAVFVLNEMISLKNIAGICLISVGIVVASKDES